MTKTSIFVMHARASTHCILANTALHSDTYRFIDLSVKIDNQSIEMDLPHQGVCSSQKAVVGPIKAVPAIYWKHLQHV